MNRNMIVILTASALVAAGAAPALAQSQDERHLDANADGVAQEANSTNVFDAEVNVTGDVIVQDSDEGQDEAAFTRGLTATANVTVGEDEYEIPVGINGEGTSLEQAGLTADGWRLHVQGTQVPDGGEDTSLATFSGNVTLTGGEDGEYVLEGEGILTVVDGEDTTTYQLGYSGQATFE